MFPTLDIILLQLIVLQAISAMDEPLASCMLVHFFMIVGS